MTTQFIIELLLRVQNFENSAGSAPSVEDFRRFLNKEYYASQSPDFISEKVPVKNLDNELAKQVILLGRFTRQMIRRGLSDFPELDNEEFTYLYRLMDEEMLTKMQLIERNAQEKQTGMAIIARMVSNGLIEEIPDENDRRAKCLKVTEKGRKMFYDSTIPVNKISKVLGAKLSDPEKEKFLATLQNLNEFHFMVYNNFKDADIDEINNLI